jgi:hypothetical protein
MENLRDGIPEPLDDLCEALGAKAIASEPPVTDTAEARAAVVIRILAETVVFYEHFLGAGPARAVMALSMACELATLPPIPDPPKRPRPPKASRRPPAKHG